ncbi:hypothetical protein CMQ_5978 [Grosmannia clavigera kw1407]|uniref:Ubiquitin-like domain-containing protein n=1 Tax=Grosmannia clavigera (strain kw1407 / UAMH 11150) TaxID=655863 RepID=F0XLZ8_GROCL|nr:uncharacterized protein CMQ_5978 [Grosmannia clavigera kw1407]EFX01036.1 hypothetical protein CMQ_5978 [Grosmannia clavigera kw1407]
MVESAAPAAVPADPTEKSAEQTVDLRLISPSWETADSPLLAGLSASTTIGQLKERVQEEVTTRGRSWQGMRLIHRGRVLEGDARTLADVFGPNPEPGALAVHLVLRDPGSNSTAQPASTMPTAPSSQAAATAPPTATIPRLSHQQHVANQAQAQAQAAAVAAAAATAAATANARWMHHFSALNNMQQGVPMPAPTPSQQRWSPGMPGQPVHNTAPTAHGQTAGGHPSQEQGQPSAAEVAGLFTTTNVTVQNAGGRNTVTYSTTTNLPARAAAPQPQEAYILSSPAGPRALLVHGDAELYLARNASAPAASNQGTGTLSSGETWGAHMRINNPGAGMLAAMVPHIWLVARLLLFVWWFTSPDASWTRWSMVILLATAMFVANTGMLDGAANHVWEPIRRHLDGLVPAVNVGRAPGANVNEPAGGQQAAAVVPGNNGGGAGGEPNPAQMAARLVGQQRQANGDWLMEQIRRAERVGIMFLASLAPGVAERHVALVEQRQAEAERQRQAERDAAEAAAAAAVAEAETEAAAAAEGADVEEAEVTGDSTGMDGIAATPEVTTAAE